jgi:hypothetical protein
VICPPCKAQLHEHCPGGNKCDCQHSSDPDAINRILVPKPAV